MRSPLLVSYGGGVNSTAMLVGLSRTSQVDAILFADTGGERPETYQYVATVSAWAVANGLPPIQTIRTRVSDALPYTTLEGECLTRGQLPSLAYGWHKCAEKWKVRAQIQFAKHWSVAQECWKAGGVVRKAVGFHAGETRRVKPHIIDAGYEKIYPLIEWGWYQEDCLRVIAEAGLPPPSKSACFFCPASTKAQVRELARTAPDLFQRALAIEDAALAAGNLKVVKGLGRHWTWREVAAADEQACAAFRDTTETPCGCWDGGEDD